MSTQPMAHQHSRADRRVFRVFWDGDLLGTYDPAQFPTTRDVTDDLLSRWSSTAPRGLDEWDLSVWRDGRVVAIVRTGASGSPEVTHFADIPG